MKQDNVNHPSHYNIEGRKECWEEMIEKFGIFYTAVFDVMNAYKYFYRAGMKEGNTKEQDLRKIKNYMEHAENLINNNDFYGQLDCLKMYLHMKDILEREGNYL